MYFNSLEKLEGTGKDGAQEFFVRNLNHSAHLCVLLTEDVGQTLEKNARLDECIKREALFSLWIKAVQQALDKLWRETITHLCQHYNIRHHAQSPLHYHDIICDSTTTSNIMLNLHFIIMISSVTTIIYHTQFSISSLHNSNYSCHR